MIPSLIALSKYVGSNVWNDVVTLLSPTWKDTVFVPDFRSALERSIVLVPLIFPMPDTVMPLPARETTWPLSSTYTIPSLPALPTEELLSPNASSRASFMLSRVSCWLLPPRNLIVLVTSPTETVIPYSLSFSSWLRSILAFPPMGLPESLACFAVLFTATL